MRRRPYVPLAFGALGPLGLWLVWTLAHHAGPAQRFDAKVLDGFSALDHGRVGSVASVVPHFSDSRPFVATGIVLLGIALARGRPRHALAVAVVLVGANLSTQLLKPIATQYRPAPSGSGLHFSEWPSGHATASLSLALCAVLVCSARWRPIVAALGAAWSIAVCLTLLVAAWHFPSDVVAGYLMAATWTAWAVAALWAAEARSPVPVSRERPLRLVAALGPVAAVAVAGVALGVVVALARPIPVAEYAREHTSLVVGAAFIAALGLVFAAALSAATTTTRRR